MSAVIVLELFPSFETKISICFKNRVYECPSISKGLPTFRLILYLQQTFLIIHLSI